MKMLHFLKTTLSKLNQVTFLQMQLTRILSNKFYSNLKQTAT
ncbi:hypothetical protein FLM9_1599 [Candidatus Synechococcus spongiarum]|uniref:Uncharacterized protein n=1 Tax=Candidatus Synechococcus spongiarum TaxID=431041 RepID=A0A165B3L0_9SYNE|nr:hypothetical protein FLM9_1599 [Candidatus Synechococcus spongiarum]